MTPDSREVPVTVIIVTFASQDVVGRTLSALASAHDSGLLDCLVVDNASPDRTREVVASDHPWVRMIASPKNLGYGRACNLGFNEVTTPSTPTPSDDQLVPFHLAIRLIGTPPTLVKIPPA